MAQIKRDNNLLRDNIHVLVEEQLAIFLHIVAHKSKNRVMSVHFIRSIETVSRYFNNLLGTICILRSKHLIKLLRKWTVAHYGTPIFGM